MRKFISLTYTIFSRKNISLSLKKILRNTAVRELKTYNNLLEKYLLDILTSLKKGLTLAILQTKSSNNK